MSLKIKSQEDFWAGLMFIGFGILAIIIARDYPMGSTMRMGPGYFPTYIGVILIILGAIISGISFKFEGERVGAFAWRPMILLSIAFAAFGWAIDNIGFILAMVILIVLASLAGKEFRLKEAIGMVLVLVAGSWALFIYGLELPFPLWWWR
ncbi:MAG: tripartite tricarboxylate transporter TctB family protein [Alphaproteobacteria bacterium]|nr:tripartite tricarboxylate transporter TctB family protein [Alphaproteobacteria bacterium]